MKTQLHLLLIQSEEAHPHGLCTFLGIFVIHELSIHFDIHPPAFGMIDTALTYG
jgi:hypothetical protein